MKYREIAFVGYPVTDMARARKFYEEVLGLEVSSEFGPNFIEYSVGTGTLSLGKMDTWQPSKDGPSAALEAEDFDAVVAALKSANAEFVMEAADWPNCRMCIVRDPDGNMVTIHRRKKE
jgi:predicted enzyme related to lactoylglutathione lyase